jgi:excisionase family DNA binding protein
MEAELLTPAEVAEKLNVSRALVYVLIKSGEIPSIRIVSLVRVRKEDLEKYIHEKAGSSAPHGAETSDGG